MDTLEKKLFVCTLERKEDDCTPTTITYSAHGVTSPRTETIHQLYSYPSTETGTDGLVVETETELIVIRLRVSPQNRTLFEKCKSNLKTYVPDYSDNDGVGSSLLLAADY